MPRPLSPRAKRRPAQERGVALIIAIVAITLLTVVATDFAYNTRVDLQLATNQRDEMRAYFLARSGIGLSRLLLRFQKQLDSTPIPNLSGMLAGLTGGAGGAAGAGAGAAAGGASSLNIQLWRMARVDCHMLQGLVKPPEPAEDAPIPGAVREPFDDEYPELAARQKQLSFGGFEGCFLSTISDEEEKLNLQRLNAGQGDARPTLARMMDLLGDKRFEFLFERDDANGVRATPAEIIVALKDWIDEDQVQSTFNLTSPTEAFLSGFSDEGSHYDRFNPSYEPKNARFDSMDELYRVHGVTDRFMAAFRDRLTVYPDMNAKPNINTEDPMMLYMAILSVADPLRPSPQLQNPVFIQELITRIRTARMFSFLGMSVSDFVSLVEAAGIPVNPSIRANVAGNRLLGDRSTTFTLKSVGEAGAVQKTITAVVRLDEGLGRLVYWREE